MTAEEILSQFPNGLFIESVPEPNPPEGQQEAGLFINPQTNELWYEYEDIPPTPISPEEKIAQLEQFLAETNVMLLEFMETTLD
jgi:hypothetical protein